MRENEIRGILGTLGECVILVSGKKIILIQSTAISKDRSDSDPKCFEEH